MERIFIPKNKVSTENIKGYTIKYGNIVDNSDIIDEVLVSYFKAPKSYTTEDMCEISSHGGNIIMKKILELCLQNGADLAEPGEFTKRAFLNGRIDLVQAESVIDIINAKSEKEAKAGVNQLKGSLSNKITEIKEDILNIMTNIEVSIDYPEYDDIEEVKNKEIEEMLNAIEEKLRNLEKTFDNGKIIKDGIKTAIVGKPNAGKSSLLNAILNEERAIVTEFEGTTRDTIEEFVNIKGIPLKIIDTAGIRETNNEVEKIGIAKSREITENADLIISIFDSSKELSKEDLEILKIIQDKKAIIILNKSDLEEKVSIDDERIKKSNKKIIKMSAKNKQGIETLYNEIEKMFNLNEINLNDEVVITNIRHKNLISKSIKSINKTRETIKDGMPIDIIAIFLREILEDLGNITGELVNEEIIDDIFSKFCLGK